MNVLNKYFDKIVYINLKRREDRNIECIDELKKYNIIAERFEATDGNSITKPNWKHNQGSLGCVNSHLEVIKYAKANNYKSILILEDDVVFSDDMEETFENIYKQVPNDWDILYLSGNHNLHEGYALNMINENVAKCYLTYTTHSFAVKECMYDTIIERLSNAINPVDVEYTHIQKICNSYTFYPGISSQRVGFSDIMNCDIDYTKYIK